LGTHRESDGGTFVVSLDFELHWGVRDVVTLEAYRPVLEGVRPAILGMLERFSRDGIHATWATVGLLMCEGRDDARARAPTVRAAFERAILDPYPELDLCGESEAEDPLHFAPSLVRRIAATAGQELATHTFSHYHLLEAGGTDAAFAADLAAAVDVMARFGRAPASIVFPKNQFRSADLRTCAAAGIRAFRPNPTHTLYRERPAGDDRLWRRAARLVDAHLRISGADVRRPWSDAATALVAAPSSRMLRATGPGGLLARTARLRRVRAGMSAAAKAGGMYHLWWHPHNFGADPAGSLDFLDAILAHFRRLRQRYGMVSLGMAEVADLVLSGRIVAEGART